MKNLLFITCCLFTTGLFAQTEAETLDWLNTKKIDIGVKYSRYWCTSHGASCIDVTINFRGEQMEIKASVRGLYGDHGQAYTLIGKWSQIKEVKKKSADGLEIVFDFTINGKPAFIDFETWGENKTALRDKFVKAIEHMAKLKGANLIKEDLF